MFVAQRFNTINGQDISDHYTVAPLRNIALTNPAIYNIEFSVGPGTCAGLTFQNGAPQVYAGDCAGFFGGQTLGRCFVCEYPLV